MMCTTGGFICNPVILCFRPTKDQLCKVFDHVDAIFIDSP